jgi:hypothetical protein
VLRVVVRILESGLFLALLYTSLSMAIASLTDRRAVAAGATLFVLLGSAIVSETFVEGLGASAELLGLNLSGGPLELVARIYGRPGFAPSVETWVLALTFGAWTIGASAVAIVRYRRLQVTR